MKTLKLRMSLLMLGLVGSLLSTTTAAAEQEIVIPVTVSGLAAGPVEAETDVVAVVHDNPQALPFGITMLAVHGFTETADTWRPLIDELFSRPVTKLLVKRVIALELPGGPRGGIPDLTPDQQFGNLLIDDNIAIVIQAIGALRDMGMGPRTIVGHSMGGLAIQGVQEALLSQGSSLSDLGVKRAILLAAVPALSAQWTAPPPTDLSAFVQNDPFLGTYIFVPAQFAILGAGFISPALGGVPVPGTPTAVEMEPLVSAEPIVSTLQLVGQPINEQIGVIPRPDCREGAFKPLNGTLLTVVGFEQDLLTPQVDQQPLYEYLIGRPGLMYRAVNGDEAVHNMLITDPGDMLDQMFGLSNML